MNYNFPRDPNQRISIFNHPRYVPGGRENTRTLQRFSEAMYELQLYNPEIIGSTLAGSRLIGKGRRGSDIDATVLIDASALEARGIVLNVAASGDIEWSGLRDEYRDYLAGTLAPATRKDRELIR